MVSLRTALVTTLALALATTGSADRNNASEIVRGGAWLYHTDAGPCGADDNRTLCSFETRTPSNTRATASVTLSVSSELLNQLDALSVRMQFANFKVGAQDWVGAYCLDSESQAMDDRQYLDYQYVGASPTSLPFGPLVNMRCLWQFRYFTYSGSNAYVKLATSPFVRFTKGPLEPLHVRVAKTITTSEMRVSWVSAAAPSPIVQYGTSPSSLTLQSGGLGDSYVASDMCHSPATNVAATWFRDPGVMYTAVMTGLTSETTYYYRVCSTSAVCSKTFKLKTPPAPGSQKGVASFFVYGDLGDWNVHATGPLPVKRSSTTIQLMRRDMDEPNANYVAIMHDGDLSYAMGKTYLWDQFGALIESVASEIPYMVGIGNHEYCYTSGGANDPSGAGATDGFHPPEGNYGGDSQGECAVPTNKRFIMPANGNKVFWWSTEIGLVHHTQISSEHDYTPGSAMYKWLENDLKSVDRKKTPWLMLHLHRPMYTSEAYESDNRVSLLIRRNLEPLLGKYRVDAVFSGHYHAYELTCPVHKDQCRAEGAGVGLIKAKAPVHIMVGSAGADVDNVGYYDVPWRLDAQLEYGYGRVHVHNASHAKWEFVRNRDEVVASSMWLISDHDWVV